MSISIFNSIPFTNIVYVQKYTFEIYIFEKYSRTVGFISKKKEITICSKSIMMSSILLYSKLLPGLNKIIIVTLFTK